jgi:hypothetical protein
VIGRTFVVVCGAAAWLALSGCSIVNDPAQHMGGMADGGVDATVPRVEGSALCTRLITLQCEQYVRCCSSAPMDFDVPGCIESLLPPCRDGIGAYLADERTGYDPEIAAEALAEGEALSAACSLDIARWVATREGLFRSFAGTVPAAGDCTPTSATDVATFVSCDRLDYACTPALGDRFLCAPRVGAGASCFLDNDCVEGLACIRSVPLDPATGRCGDRLAAGAVCRQSTDCESYYCHVPTGLMVGTCAAATQDNVYCGVAD